MSDWRRHSWRDSWISVPGTWPLSVFFLFVTIRNLNATQPCTCSLWNHLINWYMFASSVKVCSCLGRYSIEAILDSHVLWCFNVRNLRCCVLISSSCWIGLCLSTYQSVKLQRTHSQLYSLLFRVRCQWHPMEDSVCSMKTRFWVGEHLSLVV
jgi:hypothetical protein